MGISQNDVALRLELAKSTALEAGVLTLRYFRADDLEVERKKDDSVVTIADKAAEELMREQIEEAFPDDGIIGEEHGTKEGTSGFDWILDPIDGTQSFVCGVPLYGTLVGISYDQIDVAGVINMPALDEYAYAMRGKGAFVVTGGGKPRQAKVTETDTLHNATVCTTSPHYFRQSDRLPIHGELVKSCKVLRGWSDCYGFLLLATGRCDAVVEPVMNLWDGAALKPIVEEAGGLFTAWDGADTAGGGDVIASNRALHEELMALVRTR